MKSLRAFLGAHRKIGVDSSIFIYYVEDVPVWAPLCEEFFHWLARPGNQAVTSTLTMTEVLVQPYGIGNELLVNRYFALLSLYPNLNWIAPDLATADSAARIRATHRLRTPDALQVATAIHAGATALLTNDIAIARVTGIDVGVLEHFRSNQTHT